MDSSRQAVRGQERSQSAKWWRLAAVSALLLTLLTVAGVYLITRKPSTVDQIVILTVPSGAEIKLDSRDYGHTPVKLEQVPIATYTLTITKEGFEPIVERITVSESTPLVYKLIPKPLAETSGLSADEQIKQYQQRAEEAFAQGHLGKPFEESALYYTLSIQYFDPNNQFVVDMRERIRKALHQSAQAALSRRDFGEAQDIYGVLVENYPEDEEAKQAASKLEAQLSSRKGEVLDLVRKAEQALSAGNLIEPARDSAFFYSRQALAIDRQNQQALSVRNAAKERLVSSVEDAIARGEIESAIKQLEQITERFNDDKQLRQRLRELSAQHTSDLARESDPNTHRLRGLQKYRDRQFAEAIPDLNHAVINGKGTPDVIFSLADSYLKLGRLEEAVPYFLQVPQTAPDSYRSSRAALGDIAMLRGDTSTALARYKEARQLGGSMIYTIPTLDNKIENIEKRQRDKAAEPMPVSIQVKHLHGGLFGDRSCSGTLTINSTGVRYSSSEHNWSSNLAGFHANVSKDRLELPFTKGREKFKASPADAERFLDALGRYQEAINR
jgi:PEGA domain-containing protein/tetratricopeptide repeat protein